MRIRQAVAIILVAGFAELIAVLLGLVNLGSLLAWRRSTPPRPSASLRTVPSRTSCDAAWQDRFISREAVPLAAANVVGLQDIPAGGTEGATSMLVQRGWCSTNLTALVVDEIPAGSGVYHATGIPPIPGLNLTHEEGVTMAADGLTIIAMTTDSRRFRAAKRSAIGEVDFRIVAEDEFANIVAATPEVLWAPSISGDGLAFYYSVVNDPDPEINGIYESLRVSTRAPFPRAKRMPTLVQTFAQLVNGVSADHLGIFLELKDDVEGGYATIVLSRSSPNEPFLNPNAPSSPPRVPGLRTRPIDGCNRLVGSCAPYGGGCRGEDICTWTAN